MVFRHGRTGLFGHRLGLLRRLGWLSIASAVWSNRRDVKRWFDFGRRAVQERDRPVSDLVTEAKVRAAVSRDPLLRLDASLEDVRVDDGVVTMLTNTASWPDPRDQMVKLKQVKGITDVAAEPAPVTPRRTVAGRSPRSPRSPFDRHSARSAAHGTVTNSPSSAGSAAPPAPAGSSVTAADAAAAAVRDLSTTGGR